MVVTIRAFALYVAVALPAALAYGVIHNSTGQRYEEALRCNWAAFLPPWPAYRGVMWLATALDRVRNAIVPPQIRMVEHSMVFARTQVIHILAALRIPDSLADGPMTAEQLATPAGVASASALWRVLRLAVAQGILAGSVDSSGSTLFRNTALSSTLRSEHPSSVRDFVIVQGQEMVPIWGGLLPALRSGKAPWAEAHPAEAAAGRDFWGYLEARPEAEQLFSGAMANADTIGVEAMLTDFLWQRFSRFIDVGGATGSFMAALLRRHPHSSGVLFDLPQVVKRSAAQWQQQHAVLLPRAQFAGGSFFDAGAIPVAQNKGDVYIMRTILHDWPDKSAAAILSNTRAAIGTTNATLALLELTPAEGIRERYEGYAYMCVQMLAVCDGLERSPDQWRQLFAATGFRLVKVWPTRGTLKVVEAVPV